MLITGNQGPGAQRMFPRMDVAERSAIERADSLLGQGGGVFFKRQLEYVRAQTLRAKTPPKNGLMLFPMDTSIPLGFRSFITRMTEELGEADWVGNWSEDLPRVDLNAKEISRPVKAFGTSYGYTWMDIQTAMQMGLSLDAAKAVACRRANEQFLNKVVWYGDTEVGVAGVLTHGGIPRHYFENAIAEGTTEKVILAMLHAFVNAVWKRTRQAARPDTLAVPTDVYTYLTTTYRSDNSEVTLLDAFLAKNPYVKRVVPVWELDAAGPDGEDVMFLYPSNTPGAIKSNVILPFRQFPAQQKGMAFNVPCISISGGMSTEYPLECSIGVLPKAA